VKTSSYVITVIYTNSNLIVIHPTYIYVLFKIMYMINEFISLGSIFSYSLSLNIIIQSGLETRVFELGPTTIARNEKCNQAC
jgi:hypothetical protein